MSALSALLWHWGVLQVIVRGISYALQRSLGIGGAVGLGAASNVFLGQIEAPLLIRPYLSKLTRAELFMLFTVGLATVAGTVMVLYATVLEPVVPGALGHILVASFISLPASILVAHLMVPGESHDGCGSPSRRRVQLQHGRDCEGHRGRAEALSRRRRDAARDGGARRARQHHDRRGCRT